MLKKRKKSLPLALSFCLVAILMVFACATAAFAAPPQGGGPGGGPGSSQSGGPGAGPGGGPAGSQNSGPAGGQSGHQSHERVTRYTVTFDANGGTLASSSTVKVNAKSAVDRPADPTRDGYVFVAWSTTSSNRGRAYNFSAPVKEDITLYAKWKRIYYQVAFDANGGALTSRARVRVGSGDAVSRPTDPTRDGYQFIGWFTARQGGKSYDFSAPVTGNITVYARWIKTLSVTFDPTGGMFGNGATTPLSTTVTWGARIDSGVLGGVTPTRAGYEFAGWYFDKAGKLHFDARLSILLNTKLYAKWTKCKNYTLVVRAYDADASYSDGTAQLARGAAYDASALLPAPASGYTWELMSGVDEATGHVIEPAAGVAGPAVVSYGANTIYVAYKEVPLPKHGVDFDSQGGSSVESVQVTEGFLVPEPDDPTRDGYDFTGWYKDPECTQAWEFESDTMGVADMTLYAGWSEVYVPPAEPPEEHVITPPAGPETELPTEPEAKPLAAPKPLARVSSLPSTGDSLTASSLLIALLIMVTACTGAAVSRKHKIV